LGSAIRPQDVPSGEEDGRIPNYIHLENSRRNAPNVGIKVYTSTRQGRLCRVPQIKQCATGKIRAIREGSFQIRGPQLSNTVRLCWRDYTLELPGN